MACFPAVCACMLNILHKCKLYASIGSIHKSAKKCNNWKLKEKQKTLIRKEKENWLFANEVPTA